MYRWHPALLFSKQNYMTCTKLRPAMDEELPSAYIEEFRSSLDVELSKYVGEAYPKGVCAVYCTNGKDVEGPGADFGFVVVISAAKRSPQNFCNGSWRSVWTTDFSYELQYVDIKGKIQVGAHYFEEGNVQIDTNVDRKDSTILQSPEDSAVSITNIIRHHESEYFSSLEESYLNLSDATFKDLRRKLPVTRTLFPWHILVKCKQDCCRHCASWNIHIHLHYHLRDLVASSGQPDSPTIKALSLLSLDQLLCNGGSTIYAMA